MKRTMIARITADGYVREVEPDLERDAMNILGILESRQAPGSMGGDRPFLEGKANGRQFADYPSWMADEIAQETRAAGISTVGKVYVSGLADGRDYADPKAWCSGVDDVKAVMRERNLTARRGLVKHIGHEEPPTPDVPLAADLVAEEVVKIVAADPKRKRDLRAVKEEVVAKHARKDKRSHV